MSEETRRLFDERLGRYQAAIALEPTDRIPIATGSNSFAEVYSGNNHQETLYDAEKWLQAELAFCRDFPEVDVLRNNRVWGPLYDAIGLKSYRLPGRDLPPHSPFQFVEKEYMQADEYDLLIKNPLEFMFDRWLPRIVGEFKERGSIRSYMAFLKGGMAQAQVAQIMKNRGLRLQEEAGMPQPMTGAFLAPFDALADALRGLTGSLMDTYRQPDKVIAACDVLTYEMANFALATADPLKRYPIFVPTHKATFMSPAQFDKFYWPSFKKTMEITHWSRLQDPRLSRRELGPSLASFPGVAQGHGSLRHRQPGGHLQGQKRDRPSPVHLRRHQGFPVHRRDTGGDAGTGQDPLRQRSGRGAAI